MLITVKENNRQLYEKACAFERVMGSRCLNSLLSYGELHPDHRFLMGRLITGELTAALYLAGEVLTISANDMADSREIADFIICNGVEEVDTSLELASNIQALIGGDMESSYFMMYPCSKPPEGDFSIITPYKNLKDVFTVLQRSHEYYRTHFRYEAWAADIKTRLSAKTMELYQFDVDGKPVGTGSIASLDNECGVVAAVAVVPEHRGRGYGTLLSKFLTKRIMEMGKTPRLLSGYDEVAELYRRIGYLETGRWGELYLK